MTAYLVPALMAALTLAALVALWHCCVAINHMTPKTDLGIRFAYVLKAGGYFTQILSVGDYAHGEPMAWPWLLLAGVAVANVGTALLQLANRRICRCPDCPLRRCFVVEQAERES